MADLINNGKAEIEENILISTHDRRLAKLLERKLAPRSTGETTAVIDFLGWDRSGPSVEQREPEPHILVDPIRVVQRGKLGRERNT